MFGVCYLVSLIVWDTVLNYVSKFKFWVNEKLFDVLSEFCMECSGLIIYVRFITDKLRA